MNKVTPMMSKLQRIHFFFCNRIPSVNKNTYANTKGMAAVNGVKNHNPVKFTLLFREAKNIIANSAIQKFRVLFLITKNNTKALTPAINAGRNLKMSTKGTTVDSPSRKV